VASTERIEILCAQLLRAEHPAIINAVATQLQEAIQEYAQNATRHVPILEQLPSSSEKIAA